ncbi:MAG: hypothetical protein O2800_07465 [Planctomycetota bacterium]|nr:hypothetical protein [Planctomycetota bacterium]
MSHEPNEVPYTRQVPAPTAWPLAAALALTMIFAGIVTSIAISVVGVALGLVSAVGWFRACFPIESTEPIEAVGGMTAVVPPAIVARVHEGKRRVYPESTHPMTAGIRGGLAGGAAMAFVAVAWGVAEHGSMWLPINLLAGVVTPSMNAADESSLSVFNAGWLVTAVCIHAAMSVLVGLLFTITLAMWPSRPILMGAVIVPVVMTGLMWPILGIVNPALEHFIAWPWFIASEVAFGLICGWIVNQSIRISSLTGLPLHERLEIEQSNRGGQ